MGGLLCYLVSAWAGSAYGPAALERHLDETARRGHLPVAFARELEDDVGISLHFRSDHAIAAYLPAFGGEPERLALYAPFYLRGLDLVPVVDMPVDVSEYYFHALLLAHLRRQLGRPAGELGWQLRSRAETTMADVPGEHRVAAYLDALASFGSHLLSVANEVERKQIQREARGGLCPLLERGAPLLVLWERIFATEGYPGSWVDPEGRVRYSRSVLTPDDKRFLLDAVLHSTWRGSAQGDLGPRYCHD